MLKWSLLVLSLVPILAVAGGIESSGRYWSGGMFIARPLKAAADQGFLPLLGTKEFEISYGAIPGHDKYVGTNKHVSSKSRSVLEKFQSLDMNKSYIFVYEYPFYLNPVWNDTHTLITEIREMKTPSKEMMRRIEGDQRRVGRYNPHSERNGVLVEVERWGFINVTCTVTLHQGGVASGKNSPFLDFVLYGEKNCAAAEALMAYGIESKVSYSQDAIEIWHANRRIIKSIDVVEEAERTSRVKPTDSVDDIRQKLLNDPQFLRELRDRLNKLD